MVTVFRYEVPGIHAVNFVLENSLGGGGIASLRSDPQVCICVTAVMSHHLDGNSALSTVIPLKL